MGKNIIKDFVEKQTTSIEIRTPKTKKENEEFKQEVEVPKVNPDIPEPGESKAKTGRPRTYEKRVKISIYLPEDHKEKLIRIQHQTFKSSLNDIMMEAIIDLFNKYGY